MKKFFVILLLFIQSFFLGVNAQGVNSSCPIKELHTQITVPNHKDTNGFIFIDFQNSETALLTINNTQETITSCLNKTPNPCGGLNNSVSSNSENQISLFIEKNKDIAYINDKNFSISKEICTRAP